MIDVWRRRIGLRTIVLDRHADKFGESFQFVVNGRIIFAKGANWIPAHSFVTEADRALYDDLLTSAADANMNMLRVWGWRRTGAGRRWWARAARCSARSACAC